MGIKRIPRLKIKMSCCNPKRNPLNGYSANTESGRLRRQMARCVAPEAEKVVNKICCDDEKVYYNKDYNPTITPTESSYLASKMINCGSAVRSGAVPQDVARALLERMKGNAPYITEGVRIAAVEQKAQECSVDPESETARFSMYERFPPITVCPPLPPPPAPPAKQCPLQKNQKFY